MAISWEPLAERFGARVLGLDLSRAISDADAQDLKDFWLAHGVLLFRGQPCTPDAHMALSWIFGDLEVHPAREAWVQGHPELTAIEYDPANRANTSIYEVDGVELANWLPWHIDLIYMPRISRAGCLRALTIPPMGADTGFIDRQALYETLPDALRLLSAGRRILYRLNPHADQHRFYPYPNARMTHTPARISALAARVERDFPVVSHPVQFAHADTKAWMLNVSPLLSIGMEDMPQEEGDALLRELVAHTLASPHRYYHCWQVDDLLLWDNWRMLHSAEGTPTAHARRLHRTTIQGDYGLGRFAEVVAGGKHRRASAATVRPGSQVLDSLDRPTRASCSASDRARR